MSYESAPGMSEGHHAPTPTATKPASVSLAQKLMYAGAGITLISGLLSLFTDQDAVRDQVRQSLEAAGQATDAGSVDAAVQLGMVMGIVVAVVSAGLWVLMAWLNGKGLGWARIVATVLGILGVLLTVTGLIGAAALPGAASAGALNMVISIVTGLIALAVVVLLWRPDANAFFAAHKGR